VIQRKKKRKKKQEKIKFDIKRADDGDEGDGGGGGGEENEEDTFGPCSLARTLVTPQELSVDDMFYEKLHKYMQNIADQTSKSNRTLPHFHFPHHLGIYAADSFHEYHKHSVVFRRLQQQKQNEENQKKKDRDDLLREELGLTPEQWSRRPPSPKANPMLHQIWCPDLSFDINTNVGGE